jgi:hypothetical protein
LDFIDDLNAKEQESLKVAADLEAEIMQLEMELGRRLT